MQQEAHHQLTFATVPDAPSEPGAFLRWAAARPREEGRYELTDGVVTRIMINVTRGHARICTNLLTELARLCDLERFECGAADFAIRTRRGIRVPDVFVAHAGSDLKSLSTDKPIFLAEVLSSSTAGLDFTVTLHEYTAIESLETYMICSQDEPRAWVWSRKADRGWPEEPAMLEGRNATIELGGLGIKLSLAAVFRGIPDAPTTN